MAMQLSGYSDAGASRVRHQLACLLATFIALFAAGVSRAADLLTFCTSPVPPGDLKVLYDSQCPAYLAAQFASGQAAGVSAQLTQTQTQTSINTALAGLVKAPVAQVPSGTDLGGLAGAVQLKDAELTYKLAALIGRKLASATETSGGSSVIDAMHQVLFVGSANDRAALFASPVDSDTVQAGLDQNTEQLAKIACGNKGGQFKAQDALAGILGAEAIASVAATATSMFQPSLLSASKVAGVTDPTQLLVAGVYEGLGGSKSYLRLGVPLVVASNSVLVALKKTRDEIGRASKVLAQCPADPNAKAFGQALTDAKAYLISLTQSTGGNPSLLDLAARRASLKDANVKYTLLLQRDVSSGGAAAIKPNWFRQVSIVMATADWVTYELVNLDSTIALAGHESLNWSDTCNLKTWTEAFSGCSKTGK